jgi:hypothetical protein
METTEQNIRTEEEQQRAYIEEKIKKEQFVISIDDMAKVVFEARKQNPDGWELMQTARKLYEQGDNPITTIDSAYPIQIMYGIQDETGLKNIGNFGFAYTKDGAGYHGLLIPFTSRALTILEILIAKKSKWIYAPHYGK